MPSSLCLLGWISNASFAGEFFTIIGPDGRPMVVQGKASEPPEKQVKQGRKQEEKGTREVSEVKVPVLMSARESAPQPIQPVTEMKAHLPDTKPAPKKKLSAEKQVTSSTVIQAERPLSKTETKVLVQQKVIETTQQIPQAPVSSTQTIKSASTPQSITHTDLVSAEKSTAFSSMFNQMDGTDYVRNEYLEDREFNLEGKRRFYTMPEGVIDHKTGATRFQVIEREKGVSKSVLNAIFKPKQKENLAPIALASTYYRMSQQDTIDSLGKSCFKDKKLKKAKSLQVNHDINVWPKKPIKENFEFEIIKVDSNIQNIQLNSYASTQNDPTFYWPFAVFLDQNACVLEGVGGFKNDENSPSMLSHEMIAGILHVPEQSHYLLLTPLSSAVDVEHKVLTNHGQLKLIAIR
ncbi:MULTISPECIES: putative pilus assembly protein FilE [Acinetobacter]|uniref:putative pilus assembly protein FilE n=1 Tax=Acinetobacter TaxID=469 RepID=UPI00143B30D1|nr:MULTISPECIES: putative pilus assembly protein FilE [Acinetobacter]MDD0804160.1 putative pilus assembly protein FilE [Acinetobacter sp. Gutcm_16]NKG38526.1 oxidoreductase [Acinetobacter johnsonii]